MPDPDEIASRLEQALQKLHAATAEVEALKAAQERVAAAAPVRVRVFALRRCLTRWPTFVNVGPRSRAQEYERTGFRYVAAEDPFGQAILNCGCERRVSEVLDGRRVEYIVSNGKSNEPLRYRIGALPPPWDSREEEIDSLVHETFSGLATNGLTNGDEVPMEGMSRWSGLCRDYGQFGSYPVYDDMDDESFGDPELQRRNSPEDYYWGWGSFAQAVWEAEDTTESGEA